LQQVPAQKPKPAQSAIQPIKETRYKGNNRLQRPPPSSVSGLIDPPKLISQHLPQKFFDIFFTGKSKLPRTTISLKAERDAQCEAERDPNALAFIADLIFISSA
ncbi:hypothetical protein, partial [Oryzifoliimicrobium ureilyticus]|uniref:hypothetical protein n=1 Tax=Oryzifoliimicrobium ureilyticus TaxID=3113724 RepID=UPI0030767B7B